MPPRAHRFTDPQTGSAITVHVTPRAARTAITGIMDDGTVKIKLAAAPVDGEANVALVKFLADLLDVAPSHIEIVAGATGRDKLVTITGLDTESVHAKIMGAVKAK